jgi:hypothetical protein
MDKWKNIKDEEPPQQADILFCCWLDDHFSDVGFGWWEGDYSGTESCKALVIELGDDGRNHNWSPCTHWMLPPAKPPIPEASDVQAERNPE